MRINIKPDEIIKYCLILFPIFHLMDLKILMGESGSYFQSLLKGGVFITCITVFLFQFFKKKVKFISIPNQVLIAFLFYIFTSIFWSYSSSSTLVGFISISGTLSFAYLSSKYLGINKIVESYILGCSIFIVLSFILSFSLNLTVILQTVERYTGLSYGPHALARAAALIILYKVYIIFNQHKSYSKKDFAITFLLISLCIYSIIAADSRQAFIGLLLGLLALFYSQFRGGWFFTLATFLGLAFIGFSGFDSDFLNTFSRNDASEITTFTGRTFIWESTIDLIKNRPLFGYGFNAGGVSLENFYGSIYGWTTRSAHNFVLHGLLDLGFVGFSIYFSFIIYLFINIWKTKNSFMRSFVIYVVTLCLMERILAGNVGLILFFTALLFPFFTNKRKLK